MKKLLSLLFFLLCNLYYMAFSQENTELVFSKILEEILQDAPEGPDYSDLYDKLINLHEHPVSLNTAGRDELSEIFFLGELQVSDLLEYRDKYKGFMSLYELQFIKSLDIKTMCWLLFFVNTEGEYRRTELTFRDYFTRGINTLNFRYERILEKQKGFTVPDSGQVNNHYQGSPGKLYLRYLHTIGDKISYGITCEKDAGEEFFSGNQKSGFDFYSVHFYKTGGKILKTIALGDYQVNFGQGLVFSTGIGYRFTSDYASLYRSGKPLSPSRSSNEFNFLRGGAFTIASGKTQTTLFYSNRMIDANIHSADTINDIYEDYFSSLYFSGNHRTMNEIAGKKTTREQLAGGHFTLNQNKFRIGFTLAGGWFSNPVNKLPKPENYYDFDGKSFINTGVDYNFSWRHFFLYGETGFNGKTFASITGLDINISPSIAMAIVYRNYPAAYHALFANSFRAGSAVSNEKGFYLGMRFQPFRKFRISGYLDQYSIPWLSYNADQPVNNYEWRLMAEYSPNYKTKTSLKFRFYLREMNLPGNETELNVIVPARRMDIRYEFQYKPDRHWQIETKAGFAGYDIQQGNLSNGFLICQDIDYSSSGGKLLLTARYCVFYTDDYNSSVYMYENDVPGSFSIPAFYDKGSRFYLLADYTFNEWIEFWFRIGRTVYFDKNTIGSGLSEIEGSHRTDFKLALAIKF